MIVYINPVFLLWKFIMSKLFYRRKLSLHMVFPWDFQNKIYDNKIASHI